MAKKNLTPDEAAYVRLLEPPPDGHGFTKTQIAEMIGKSKQSITRWEAIPLRHVRIIHEKTGIPKADLLPSEFA